MFVNIYCWFKTLIYLTFVIVFVKCSDKNVSTAHSIAWGPGLRPVEIVLPVRYFFVQLVKVSGENITESPKEGLDVFIGSADSSQRCRIWTNILNRNDGSYIVRYKQYEPCQSLIIDLRFNNYPLKGFPLKFFKPVLPDDCFCPKPMDAWMETMGCPPKYEQIIKDVEPFHHVNMAADRKKILEKFNKRGSMSLCHYTIINNEIHRSCHGQYVGFHVFMDALLLSLTRKVKLPPLEFFVNLGDWPLEKNKDNPLPIFSWCGSAESADIVMPTYDITESTLECMGRVQLDMLSAQGNRGPVWMEKESKAFWRGRDSRQERLDLVDIARAHPDIFNVSLTNFFFFRDKEEEYGPKQPHVSFFDFFKYKYQINLDGTVAAYRMPYLLAGNVLVFKQDSPYYEYFYHDLVPGVHYIPVRRNLSNLVEQINWAMEHDSEARKIARNAAEFAQENLMPVNIFCYHAALLKEWGTRLTSKVEPLPKMELVPQSVASTQCDCGVVHDEL